MLLINVCIATRFLLKVMSSKRLDCGFCWICMKKCKEKKLK